MKNQIKKFSQYVNENEDWQPGEEYHSQDPKQMSMDFPGEERRGGDDAVAQVEVDWAPEGDVNDFLDDLTHVCREYNLTITGFEPFGPGGGNPAITFRGKRSDLYGFLRWFDVDDEDLDFYFV